MDANAHSKGNRHKTTGLPPSGGPDAGSLPSHRPEPESEGEPMDHQRTVCELMFAWYGKGAYAIVTEEATGAAARRLGTAESAEGLLALVQDALRGHRDEAGHQRERYLSYEGRPTS